jgi:hypothetical protein
MKSIEDLKDHELLELTPAAVDRFIELACAEDGVPLLPKAAPTPPVKRKELIPDLVLHELSGLYFFKREQADEVRKRLLECDLGTVGYVKLPGWKSDYNRRVAEAEYEVPKITQVELFSETKIGENLRMINETTEAEDAYKKDKENYERISKRRAEIAEKVMKVIAAARKRAQERTFLLAELERYVDLAEQDRGIALRFLAKAHPEAREILADVFENDPLAQSTVVIDGLAVQAEQEIPF